MRPKERIELALLGKKPDRVPMMPIYDIGYIMNRIGQDPREYRTASADEFARIIERSFLLHEVDGLFIHRGVSAQWRNRHRVEKQRDKWAVVDKLTGDQTYLLPDGTFVDSAGVLCTTGNDSIISTSEDLDRVIPAPLTVAEIEANEQFDALRRITAMYPDYHFSFQSTSPMVHAIRACGGFVNGLITMARVH
jgi:hypothetical protein